MAIDAISHSHKASAIAFLNLVTSDRIPEAYKTYVHPHMKHHNAYFPGDAKSLENAMIESDKQFPHKVFELKRAVAEGDMVMTHSRVVLDPDNGPEISAVHIFRFEGDKIAEMWDVPLMKPEEMPNENGLF